MFRTPYDVLGISPGASVDEAEDAYHRLLRQEHPDMHHGAGPERLAEAERRTRALNAAIRSIRTGDVAAGTDAGGRAGGGASPPPTGAGRGPTHDPGRARGSDGRWDRDPSGGAGSDGRRDREQASDDDPGSWQEAAAPATAACPWCGRRFARAVDLKDHVFDDHDLRLDRRERNALWGGRFGRGLRKAAHLPLWAVLPVNALFAIVVGLAVTAATDDLLGWWSAGIAMAPTAVVLIDRVSDLEF